MNPMIANIFGKANIARAHARLPLVDNRVGDFTYDDAGDAVLRFENPIQPRSAQIVPEGGAFINLEDMPDNALKIPFSALDKQFPNEVEKRYDLFALSIDGQTAHLQLNRQNPEILNKTFKIDCKIGYTIAGQNNFVVPEELISNEVPLSQSHGESADISTFHSVIYSNPELNMAANILSWIFDGKICIGPRQAQGHKNVVDEIQAVREGRDALQCGDLCKMWGTIAIHHGLNFRFVGLYSYGPRSEDLIAKSHAVVEIDTNDGPVLLDLWGNRIFSKGGRYLSLKEIIQALRVDGDFVLSHSLSCIPEVDITNKNGEESTIKSFYSGIEEYTNTYLNHIEIGQVKLV